MFTTRPAGIIFGCSFFGTGLGALGGVGTDPEPVGTGGPGGVAFFIACCGILGADGERFGRPEFGGRAGALLLDWRPPAKCAGGLEEL